MALHEARWVGVDGCPAGWLAVGQDPSGELSVACLPSANDLFTECRSAAVIGLDMPIGLTCSGLRETESQARRLLGARSSSVFNAPPRDCLELGLGYADACARSLATTGRKLSKQSYFLLPKIAEVDACLSRDKVLARHVWEVHPEISFALWSGGAPMRHSKHSGFGFAERLRLVEATWPGAAERTRASFSASVVSDDDILDAFAALWSAQRIDRGHAQAVGDPDARDAHGLRMCIHA